MRRAGHPRKRDGAADGLRASVPVVIGYLPAAVAFGIAARGAGLSTGETVAMSLIVFSGASQFALAGLVAAGTSWLVMVAIGLVLGVRHILYGPSLAPLLGRMGAGHAATAALGLTDEVFAVASTKLQWQWASETKFGWILGLGAGAYVSWGVGTWIGAVAGTAVIGALPSLTPALSFALPALFVALLVSLVRSAGEAYQGVPGPVFGAVLAAVIVAVALYLMGFGSWSVPVAGVIGPVAGVLIGKGRLNAD